MRGMKLKTGTVVPYMHVNHDIRPRVGPTKTVMPNARYPT
jgi:hypothetical protein